MKNINYLMDMIKEFIDGKVDWVFWRMQKGVS